MSLFALHVAAGDTGAVHQATSPEFTDFVVGQPLWLTHEYKATRISGADSCSLQLQIIWYDGAGTGIRTDTDTIVLDATVDWTFREGVVTPPVGAVKGVCVVKVTPTASPMQHDVWVKQLRLGKTQIAATIGATWGENIDDPNGAMPADFAGTTVTLRIVDGALAISGNKVTKTSGTAWDAAAYVLEPMVGTAFAQWRGSADAAWMVGLTDDPTSGGTNSYTSLDYAVFQLGDGTTQTRKLGAFESSDTTVRTDDTVYTAIYDGTKLKLYADSDKLVEWTTTPGRTFWLKICQRFVGAIRDIKVGTFSAPSWNDNLLNRPGNLAVLVGTEGIKNNQVSIGSNGALNGGGGGQVTIGGLGGGPWATLADSIASVKNPGANLVFNGGLRLGADGYTVAVTGWSLTNNGLQGNYWLAAAPGAGAAPQLYTSKFDVAGGQVYTASIDLSNSVGADLRLRVRWFDNTGAIISQEDRAVDGVGFQRVYTTFTASPGNAVQADILLFNQTGATGQVRWRNLKVEGGSSGSVFRDDNTTSVSRLTTPGRGYRLADGRNTPTNRNFGLRSTYASLTLTGSDAGTTASIAVSASTWNTDWGTTITFPSATLTGLAFSTKYYVWRNQSNPETSGESYGYSTNPNDALGTGKTYLGFCTTPADGGTSTGGSGPGIPDCVHPDAWVEMEDGSFKQARYVEAGDRIVALKASKDGTRIVEVESNHIGQNERVCLTTDSGIAVTLSANTPLTLQGHALGIAANAVGRDLPVKDEHGFRWERCVSVESAGFGEVAHIRCHQATYAAGDVRGRCILTHNPKQ